MLGAGCWCVVCGVLCVVGGGWVAGTVNTNSSNGIRGSLTGGGGPRGRGARRGAAAAARRPGRDGPGAPTTAPTTPPSHVDVGHASDGGPGATGQCPATSRLSADRWPDPIAAGHESECPPTPWRRPGALFQAKRAMDSDAGCDGDGDGDGDGVGVGVGVEVLYYIALSSLVL